MSTALAEIEKAYYRAIGAIKVTVLEENDVTRGSLTYPKHTFLQWTRQIDIYDLEKHKADFSLDTKTEDEFGEYRCKVQVELRKSFQYVQTPFSGVNIKGALCNIGSCHDGSKVERMDEVDSFYVMEGDNITVESAGSPGLYRIFLQNGSDKFEIHARSMRNQFANACDKIVSELELPTCLRHGGYNSPQHSGLRYNGPAATSQFVTEDDSLLTLDMTPTFCLPRTENIYDDVKNILNRMREFDKMSDTVYIHLIPDGGENLWRVSTAHLEANILRNIPSTAPVKLALSYCKILLSKLKKWNAVNSAGFSSGTVDVFRRVIKELDEYVAGSNRSETIAQRLNKELRYAHIWIQPEKRKLYHEDQKPCISINNAAVKYILLNVALEQPEAFADKENMDLVVKLMKRVFEVLGDASRVSSPHTFLGIDVPHLSILASQETHKVAAGLLIKEQCGTLALETMTVVGNRE